MSNAIRKAGGITALAVVAGTAITLGGVQLASAGTATATTGVNIRSGPGTSYAVVGGLSRGQSVTTVGAVKHGWVKVRFNGGRAYISAAYLTRGHTAVRTAPVTIYTHGTKIASAPLNVRRTASRSARVIGFIGVGQHVTLTGKQARGYAEVLYGGQRAWVTAQYLVGAVSGLPSTSTRTATAALLIRTTADSHFRVVTTVRRGTRLQTTGATRNGYAQIVYRKAIRWVTARYLTTGAVAGPEPARSAPTAAAAATAQKTPLPRVTGTRYATTALLIRTRAGSRYRTVTTVPRGTRLRITGVVKHGRAQIVYRGAARWVTALYLSTTKPQTAPPTDPGSGSGGSGSGGTGSGGSDSGGTGSGGSGSGGSGSGGSGDSGSGGSGSGGSDTGGSGSSSGDGGLDPSYHGKSKNVPDHIWDDMAMCEASGNWSINTGNGYYGGLQFSLQTWHGFGGTGMPDKATRLQQIVIAERVLAVQGWNAWPACSTKLGLR